MTKEKVHMNLWVFGSKKARDSRVLDNAQYVGQISSPQDLIDLSKGHAFCLYTPQLVNYIWYTREQVEAMFAESRWSLKARMLGIQRFFNGLYFMFIWPLSIRRMTLKEFKGCHQISHKFFSPDLNTFFYVEGKWNTLVVVHAHMTTVSPRGVTAGIWVRQVLYRGSNATIAQGTTTNINVNLCFVSK